MRTTRSIRRGAAAAVAAGVLTAGWVSAASADAGPAGAGHAGADVSVTAVDPEPPAVAEPTTPGEGVWGDVPGDPEAGSSTPPDSFEPIDDLAPPPPECTMRTCVTSWARYEVTNAAHNREKGRDNCNFYSGYWRTSGDDICGTINGTKWRSNNWCADFARWVWKQGGASVSGIDPWAGSFYRANRSNGHYKSKASGYRPVQGDAVLYDWDGTPSLGNDGWDVDHVGIFEKYSGSNIVVIEGNTSGGASRDGVFRKTRSTADVVGYVTPRF